MDNKDLPEETALHEEAALKAEKKRKENQIVYSSGEETVNIVTHLVGAALALAAAVLMLIRVCSASEINPLNIVAIALFSLALINLYVMSTLYHAQPVGMVRRAVFRRFDHCSIALLIAGTYAPYMLIGFGSLDPVTKIWGIVIAAVVLAMALLVIVFNAVNVAKFRVASMICYVVMGWACVIRVDKLIALGAGCFWFLIAGGIIYTVGIIFYRIKKIKFNHAIWHFFVLGGSILHFASIYFYIL